MQVPQNGELGGLGGCGHRSLPQESLFGCAVACFGHLAATTFSQKDSMLARQVSQGLSDGAPPATRGGRTSPEPILSAGAVLLWVHRMGGGWGWGAGLTEVSEGRAATFPHPTAAAQQAVGPQPTLQKI